MLSPVLDLLIVGAGPVGLSTAVAALHRGARRVLVVEQARAFQPVGKSLDLMPNAVRTLSALSPQVQEGIRPFVRLPPPGKVRSVYRSANGRHLSTTRTTDYGELATLPWWQLQQVLLSALPDGEFVVLNHQLVDIVHEPESGLACAEFIPDRRRRNDFKNWEDDDEDSSDPRGGAGESTLGSDWFSASERESSRTHRVRCRAKVVVGADGINSVARRCVYRNVFRGGEALAEPEYSGYVRVAARGSPDVSPEDEQTLADKYIGEGEMAMVTCEPDKLTPHSLRTMIVHPHSSGKVPFTWSFSFFFALDEHIAQNASPRTLTSIAADVVRDAGLPEAALRISSKIWDTQSDEDIPIRRYYNIPATHPAPYKRLPTTRNREYPDGFYRPWHFRRVVLAGDAAHAAPNFTAQGAGMGIEDAYDLVKRLEESGLWSEDESFCPDEKGLSEIFVAYQKGRVGRVCQFQREVMNRPSEYDVDEQRRQRDIMWRFDPTVRDEDKMGEANL